MAQTELDFIALRLTRHSDRQSILTAYSPTTGRLAIAVPSSQGRSASRTRALVMPLSLLSGVADLRPGREIITVKGIRPTVSLLSLHSHPAKQMVAMFIAEILSSVLRDSQGDTSVWHFIESAVKMLDAISHPRAIANFHLWFIYRLGVILGVEPDVSTYAPGSILDMRDGRWRVSHPLHPDYLDASQSRAAWMLSRMNAINLEAFRFSRSERAAALDQILAYLSLHITSLRTLRTLPILRSLI